MPDLPEDRLAALRSSEPERPALSASQVRRRGDRHRRTRHVASATIGVLAVVVFGGAVFALAPGDGESAPDPVDTPTSSVTSSALPTTIPDDTPLDAGLPQVNEDGTRVEVTGAPGVEPIEACGETIMGAEGAVDVAGVVYAGGEDYRSRTLVLFGSEAAARDFIDDVAGVVAVCPTQTVAGSTELLDTLQSTLGTGSVAFMTRFENAGLPLTGSTTYHLAPLDNGVLITSAGGETGNTPESLAGAAAGAAAGTAEVLAALVGDVPSPTESSSSAATPMALPSSTEIPAELPLDVGLDPSDGDIEVTAPSADGEGIGRLDLCGAVAWPLPDPYSDRLVTNAAGPEYSEARELWVYRDAEAASAAMAHVRGAAAGCTRDATRRWELLEADTGYDSVTLGLSYTEGLGSAIHQWTRVGAAVLLLHRAGEGSKAGLPADADRATALTRELAPELCPFTADGC